MPRFRRWWEQLTSGARSRLSGIGSRPRGRIRLWFRSEPVLLEPRVLLAAPSNISLSLSSSAIFENGSTSLSGSFSDSDGGDHLVVINWGDGSANQTIGPLGEGQTSFGPISHTYLDDNPTGTASDENTISVTVIDDLLESGTGSIPITVDNVSPQLAAVEISSPISEHGIATLSGNIIDPGTLDTFSLVVDWGDGSGPETFSFPAGTATFDVEHRYLDDDPSGTPSDSFSINLALTEDDTGMATASTMVIVNNVAPSIINLSSSQPAAEGSPVVLSGTIVDPGTQDSFTLTVDWGDGTSDIIPLVGGSTTFNPSHVYSDDGAFPVQVSLSDDDTGTGTADAEISVSNVVPTLSDVSIAPAVEGQPAVLGGSITDPGTQDAFMLLVNWGDGSDLETFLFPAGTTSFSEEHRYRDEGSYTVSVTLRDDSGIGSDAASAMVLIGNGDIVVTAPEAGRMPEIRVFDSNTGEEQFSFLAYERRFRGGVRVAVGDVNGDGAPDIITGPGRGRSAEVRVFDGVTGDQFASALGSFEAYGRRARGGIFVASGDVNGDGFDDVITGPGPGNQPQVRVFSGQTGVELISFLAFDSRFRRGVTVAAGDVNGDGKAEIITGAGPGDIPLVRVFEGETGRPLSGVFGSFLAFDTRFRGGVFVGAGDLNGDTRSDIIVSPGQRMVPRVRVFDGMTSAELSSFLAYPAAFRGGARVAAGDVNGDGLAELLTAPGPGRDPLVRGFDALAAQELLSFLGSAQRFRRGLFIAASQ